MRYFNKVIYYRDYLGGGLTDKIVRLRMDSPLASMICYSELTKYRIPLKQTVKASINYWRFRLCANSKVEFPKLKWYWNVMAPLGFLLHIKD